MLGLPLHNLETLTVHIARAAVNYSGVFDAPRLRELDVCRLSLSSRTLSDLRSLQIDSCVPSPSVDKVHNILKTSPNLKVLKLARTMTSPTGHLTYLDDTRSAPIYLAHILNFHFPNVEEPSVKLRMWKPGPNGLPILGRLLPYGGREQTWMFPKRFLEAPEGLTGDGTLEVVEARRNMRQVQAIQKLTVEEGTIGRGTVSKLKTYLEELHLTSTAIV